jgi:hypothetical protein
MIRSLCTVVLLVGTTYFGLAQDKDPVAEKLGAAKVAYEAELKNYRKEITEWFDKREEAARKDGNKKLVDQIKAERAAFEESGETPKGLAERMRTRNSKWDCSRFPGTVEGSRANEKTPAGPTYSGCFQPPG